MVNTLKAKFRMCANLGVMHTVLCTVLVRMLGKIRARCSA